MMVGNCASHKTNETTTRKRTVSCCNNGLIDRIWLSRDPELRDSAATSPHFFYSQVSLGSSKYRSLVQRKWFKWFLPVSKTSSTNKSKGTRFSWANKHPQENKLHTSIYHWVTIFAPYLMLQKAGEKIICDYKNKLPYHLRMFMT